MKRLLRILIGLIFLTFGLVLLGSGWYLYKFYPRFAEEFEQGDAQQGQSILIATQGSDFKIALGKRLAEKFSTHDIYIKAVDVSKLPSIEPQAWSAIAIINTCIANKLNADTQEFLDKYPNLNNLILLTTSGGGDFVPQNIKVDGITTASRLTDIEILSTQIYEVLGAHLDKSPDITHQLGEAD